jgi:hypothetical protein
MLMAILQARALVSLKKDMELLFLGRPTFDPIFFPLLSNQQHP